MNKALVIGIIALFICMSINPSTGNINNASFNIKSNNPPYEPSNPIPPDGATNVSIYTSLCWTGGDPDGDLVIYDVYFGKNYPPNLIINNQSLNCTCPYAELEFNTKYFWKIVAWDPHGSTEGPIWSFTTIEYHHNTLYVGGSGEGNYTTIQSAIDEANPGDTVFVYDDSSPYYENIVIHDSIYLIGEDRDSTVIDGSGSGDVISVSADWVNIKGFTIQYSGSSWPNDAGIDIRSDFNYISNNLILNNKIGLYTNSSYENTIIDNDISNNVNGISIYHSSNNILIGNNITDNHQHGIWLSSSNNNIISSNKISFSGGGIGLYVSTNNTIIGNTITSNYKGSGIGACECYNINNISGNTITYNFHGIHFYRASFQNFTSNNISNNQMYGIGINSVDHTNIEGNNIEKNEIGLYSLDCKSIFIEKNNFIKNVNQTFFDFFGAKYDSNYWSNWIGLKIKIPIFQKFPKILYGGFLSGFKFDWHPAKEPYKIEVVI